MSFGKTWRNCLNCGYVGAESLDFLELCSFVWRNSQHYSELKLTASNKVLPSTRRPRSFSKVRRAAAALTLWAIKREQLIHCLAMLWICTPKNVSTRNPAPSPRAEQGGVRKPACTPIFGNAMPPLAAHAKQVRRNGKRSKLMRHCAYPAARGSIAAADV